MFKVKVFIWISKQHTADTAPQPQFSEIGQIIMNSDGDPQIMIASNGANVKVSKLPVGFAANTCLLNS